MAKPLGGFSSSGRSQAAYVNESTQTQPTPRFQSSIRDVRTTQHQSAPNTSSLYPQNNPQSLSQASIRNIEVEEGSRLGGAVKNAGRTMQVAGGTAAVAGTAAKGAGRALEATGKAAQRGGMAAVRAGAALSSTGLGAVVGVPLAIAGGATAAAGGVSQVAGKATKTAGHTINRVGRSTRVAGKNTAQAGKIINNRSPKLLRKPLLKATEMTDDVLAVANATKATMSLFSWTPWVWITLQVPMATLAIVFFILAAGTESASSTFLGGIASSVISGLSSGLNYLTGIDLSILNPTNFFMLANGATWLIGLCTMFAIGIIYTMSSVPCLSGKGTTLKYITVIGGLVGYAIPVLNIFPWAVFWVLAVWRYPK